MAADHCEHCGFVWPKWPAIFVAHSTQVCLTRQIAALRGELRISPSAYSVVVDGLTVRQREGMSKLLRSVSGWSSARWDQHLRNEIGDDDADAVIACVGALLGGWADARVNNRIRDLRDALASPPVSAGTLTADQIVRACSNIGYDMSCGACASIFYTGGTVGAHSQDCITTVKQEWNGEAVQFGHRPEDLRGGQPIGYIEADASERYGAAWVTRIYSHSAATHTTPVYSTQMPCPKCAEWDAASAKVDALTQERNAATARAEKAEDQLAGLAGSLNAIDRDDVKAATARASEADEHARQQDERVLRLTESISIERGRVAVANDERDTATARGAFGVSTIGDRNVQIR